jgi:hypothetical protein
MHFERKLDQVIVTPRLASAARLLPPGTVGVEATYRVQIDGRNFDFAVTGGRLAERGTNQT